MKVVASFLFSYNECTIGRSDPDKYQSYILCNFYQNVQSLKGCSQMIEL